MSFALLRPHPLPLERMRPGVGFLVLVLHMALLWAVNVYWPLQSVLFGAIRDAAQSMTVQILQKNTEATASADKPFLNASSQAISNLGRQRFGRSEAMLSLPATQIEASTPLAATLQTVQTATAAPTLPTRPAVDLPTSELLTMPKIEPVPQSDPKAVPQAVAAPEPLQPSVALPAQPALTTTTATPLVAAPVAVSPVAVAVADPVPAVNPATTVMPSPVSAATANASAPSGAAPGSGFGAAVTGVGSNAAPPLSQTAASGAGAPLNLSLPPRYLYRPPIAVPRRSLSEMANDQLRRKPRDAFAEGIESAGNTDCLKDTPDGPAQGLLAIGPLLKRAIEEKCRK